MFTSPLSRINSSSLNDSITSGTSPSSPTSDFDSFSLFREANVRAPPLFSHTTAENATHLEHHANSKSGRNTFAFSEPLTLTFKKPFDHQDLFADDSGSGIVKLIHTLVARYEAIKFLYQFGDFVYRFGVYIAHQVILLWMLVLKLADIFTPLQFVVGCLPYEYERSVADVGNGRERDAHFQPHLFALHKSQLKMACAVGKGSNQIRIYDVQRKQYEKYDLYSEHHRKGIRHIEWSSQHPNQLLAVCRHGICVWDTTTKVNHRMGKCTFLPLKYASSACYHTILESGHRISCIVGSSSRSDRLHVWQSSVDGWFLRFKKPTLMGCLEELVPSPSSTFLTVQPFRGSNFRIYENHLQNFVRWVVDDRIQSSAWSPNERFFFFVTQNDCMVHVVEFYRSQPRPKVNYRFALNFEEYIDEDTRETLCGDISMIRIHGDRMAVSFKGTNLIAILQCDFQVLTLQPHLFLPVGFIRPFEERSVEVEPLLDDEDLQDLGSRLASTNTSPHSKQRTGEPIRQSVSAPRIVDMQFFEGYTRGSLLSVLFSDKTVQFFPLHYC